MIKHRSSLLLLAAPVLICANLRQCSSLPKYGLPNQAATAGYIPKAMYTDSTAVAVHAGASHWAIPRGSAWNSRESSASYTGDVSLSRSGKHWAYGLRCFASTGKYNVKRIDEYDGKYSFNEMGGSIEAAPCLNREDYNWRIAGLEFGYGKEWGHFQDLRQEMDAQQLVVNTNRDGRMWHFGIHSEVQFRAGQSELAFRLGLRQFDEYGSFSLGFAWQLHGFTLGVHTERYTYKMSSGATQIGLYYRLWQNRQSR